MAKKTSAASKKAAAKTETAAPVNKKKSVSTKKPKKPGMEIDYSTARPAPESMQNSDKNVVVYYADNGQGEEVLCADFIHKMPPEAKKALKL